jgi:hypothetical protein
MNESVRQRIKKAKARGKQQARDDAARGIHRQMGSYAEEYAAMYPGLEDHELHAIRKHGEQHQLTDDQMRAEFAQDTQPDLLTD